MSSYGANRFKKFVSQFICELCKIFFSNLILICMCLKIQYDVFSKKKLEAKQILKSWPLRCSVCRCPCVHARALPLRRQIGTMPFSFSPRIAVTPAVHCCPHDWLTGHRQWIDWHYRLTLLAAVVCSVQSSD